MMLRLFSLLVAVSASPVLGLAAAPAPAGQVGALRRPPVPAGPGPPNQGTAVSSRLASRPSAAAPQLRRNAGLPIVGLAPQMVAGDEGSGPTSGPRRRLTTSSTSTATTEAEIRTTIDNTASGETATIILGAVITVTQQLEVSGGQTIVIKAGAGTTISGGDTTRCVLYSGFVPVQGPNSLTW